MGFKDWPKWLKVINSICALIILGALGFIIYEAIYCSTNLCDWGMFGTVILYGPILLIFLALALFGIFMNYLLNKKIKIGKFISVMVLMGSVILLHWANSGITRNDSFGERFLVLSAPILLLIYSVFLFYLFLRKKPITYKYSTILGILTFCIVWGSFIFSGTCPSLDNLFNPAGCAIETAFDYSLSLIISMSTGFIIFFLGLIISKIKN
jgi:hypothetical protein